MGIVSEGYKSGPLGDKIKPVDAKEAGCNAPLDGQRFDHAGVSQLEVRSPAITKGVVKRYHGAGLHIERTDVATLVPITVGTGDAEISLDGRPIVLLSVDMIDLVYEKSIVLMQAAVGATASGPLGNEAAQGLRDVGQRWQPTSHARGS